MTSQIKQSFVEAGVAFSVLTYDMKNGTLVPELCDYAQELVDTLSLSPLSVVKEMGHLRVFWAFVGNRTKLKTISDDVLKSFREFAFAKAKKSKSHRGNEDAAKATVNAKLVRIYDWLLWLREQELLAASVVGPDGQVRTTLRGSSISGLEHSGRGQGRPQSARPALFKIKTWNSKHSQPDGVPTEMTVDKMHDFFFSRSSSEFLALRNSLVVDVASYTGFRRASIQSLRIEQFVGSDFKHTGHDTTILKPCRQKFGYGNSFEIPRYLHDLVRAFVENQWQEFVESKRVAKTKHKGHVFISSRDGRPLQDRSLTSIISEGMRSFGFPKGSALHVYRAKFAMEEVAEEYASRRKLNLDTSTESIKRAVATKLGQVNPESLHPYTSRYESEEVAKRRSGEMRQRNQDKQRIAELEAENARLKQGLSELPLSP